MKICILTPRFPYPENGGDVLRINAIAKYLKSKGHTLILVSYYNDKNNFTLANKLYDKIFATRHFKIKSAFYCALSLITGKCLQTGYYYSNSYLKVLRNVINTEKPDMYISHLLRMCPFIEKLGLERNTIVEMTDALSKTYELSSGIKKITLKTILYKIEKNRIKKYEQKVINRFSKIVLVSQSDINLLQKTCDNSDQKLFLYTNGVNCLESIASNYNKNKICFIGNMRTLQNQDAVLYFVKEIFPIIKKSIPDAVFTIIGAQPPENIKELDDGKNIIVTGFVEDINEAVSDCCLTVAPVRISAGIQNKVLVAMGCGVPVVLTSLIAGAIPELKDGENCFIKDNTENFAECCIKIMKEENTHSSISKDGYEMVKNHYSWNEKLEGYEVL